MGSGLPKGVRPIAIVVVIGAIVNVALQTLRQDLNVSLRPAGWPSASARAGSGWSPSARSS
jgi:hypothetical protein